MGAAVRRSSTYETAKEDNLELLDLARNRTAAPGFDRSIDVQISRLRRKMGGEDAEGIVKTIRGVGYMFVPAVRRL